MSIPLYSHYTLLHVSAIKRPSWRSTDTFVSRVDKMSIQMLISDERAAWVTVVTVGQLLRNIQHAATEISTGINICRALVRLFFLRRIATSMHGYGHDKVCHTVTIRNCFLQRAKYNPANSVAHECSYVFPATGKTGYGNLTFEKNNTCRVWSLIEVQPKAQLRQAEQKILPR
jgi:hypothetical protein